MSYFRPTMSELRARSAALDNPLLRLSTRCEGNRSGQGGEAARRRVCHAGVVDQQHPAAA